MQCTTKECGSILTPERTEVTQGYVQPLPERPTASQRFPSTLWSQPGSCHKFCLSGMKHDYNKTEKKFSVPFRGLEGKIVEQSNLQPVNFVIMRNQIGCFLFILEH